MVVFLSQSSTICLIFSFFFLFSSGRFLFHKNCGQFISLDSNRTTARRVDSYNHGVVLSETPLPDNHLFQVSFPLNSYFDEVIGSKATALHFFNQRQQTTIPDVAYLKFPALTVGCAISRACRRLHFFPRLPQLLFFPTFHQLLVSLRRTFMIFRPCVPCPIFCLSRFTQSCSKYFKISEK